MEVDFLNFMRNCKRLGKQAYGEHAGEHDEDEIARWEHVVLHCYRRKEDDGYRETTNRLAWYRDLREILELELDNVPDYSTTYKTFNRFKMWVWRALLRVSAQRDPQFGRVALDSTFFDRGHASTYYQTLPNQSVETLIVTTLTDTESLEILDVQCHAQWTHDTKTGPQVPPKRGRPAGGPRR